MLLRGKFNLHFFRETFLRFYSFGPVHASIRKTFRIFFKRICLLKCEALKDYEDQIVILSVFLMISSSFMRKSKKEKYFDFEWKSYFNFCKKSNREGFLLSSIRYLLDSKRINSGEKSIETSLALKPNFLQQYVYSLVYKNAKEFNHEIDINKYTELLELALKIHSVYKKEIPEDKSKVLDLVGYTVEWKQKMFELFDNKAEYIVFAFFVNLKS